MSDLYPLSIRQATLDDAPAAAALFSETRRVSMSFAPTLHTPEEDLAHLRGHLSTDWMGWVAEVTRPDGGAQIVGLMTLQGDEIEWLFVLPAYQRCGIGAALMAKAKQLRPDHLMLWVFQANAQARAFYARHGFRLVRETADENEERMPDALLEWRPD